MSHWECQNCGFRYTPSRGLEDVGIAPGTAFEQLPPGFKCPECGARRDDFEEVDAELEQEGSDEALDPLQALDDEAEASRLEAEDDEEVYDDLDDEQGFDDDLPDSDDPEDDDEDPLDWSSTGPEPLDDDPFDAEEELQDDAFFDEEDTLPAFLEDDPELEGFAEDEEEASLLDDGLDEDLEEKGSEPDDEIEDDDQDFDQEAFDEHIDEDVGDEYLEDDEDEDTALMAPWQCKSCGWIYQPSDGLPAQEIEKGTPFDDLLEDFTCPSCGAGIMAFHRVPSPSAQVELPLMPDASAPEAPAPEAAAPEAAAPDESDPQDPETSKRS